MVPNDSGGVALAWLDGGGMVDSGGTMALRTATFGSDGTMGLEQTIDRRTCECCQVSMARASGGLVAVYRDRSDTEIRDIAVAREREGRWLEPAIVAPDQWLWKACPVNGPAIGAEGATVGVAWYTGAGAPRVKAAFSSDGGARFGQPVVIDQGNPLGRVQLVMLDGGALVLWLEAKDDFALWQVRSLDLAGRLGQPKTIGKTSRARDAGFARTALQGTDLFVSWTEPGAGPDSSRVRVSRMPVADLR
jgi:hypothetical protein